MNILGRYVVCPGLFFLNSSPFFSHLYGLADTGLANSCTGVASTGMQLLILLAISCKGVASTGMQLLILLAISWKSVASRGMQLLVLLAKSWKGRLAEESDY